MHGTHLTYVARAGFIPLRSDQGVIRAKLFFVSYTVARRKGNRVRPLTFYTSGGPGNPGTLDNIGPRSLKGSVEQGQLPPPPYVMTDNEATWLTATDLVLIDPVGTGYSVAASADVAASFYNRQGDADSIANFIRIYLERYRSNQCRRSSLPA